MMNRWRADKAIGFYLRYASHVLGGVAVVEWLSFWLAEQGVRGSNLGLATWISEIGYLLHPSRNMIERLFKWGKIFKTTKPKT